MTKLFSRQTKLQIVLLIFLLAAAFFVRIYRIDQVPASLYIDEADYGLQARSLIQTWRDYRGERTPFWVHSFNDIRASIPAYFITATTLLLKTPELQVRLPSVLLGVFIVFIVFLLVRLWIKNYVAAFLTASVFAGNPWQIQFSRFAHEVVFMMAIYLAGLYFFSKAIAAKNYQFLILAAVLLSLATYSYRTMSLFIPLTFLILFLIYHSQLFFFGFKKILFIVFLVAIIILPFLYSTTINAPDLPRIAQLAITTDPEVPIWVQRNREVDSQDFTDPTLGKKPVLSSFFFHNKPLSWLDSFANNYLQTFSTDFLFLKGDSRNARHGVGQMGELYLIDIIGLIFGFILLLRNFKNREYQWLILWFLIAPIPSSLTVDGAQHGVRLFIFSAPLLLITGLGWWYFYQSVTRLRFSWLPILLVLIVWLLLLIFYLHRYFVHYPIESARTFGYGFRQAVQKINKFEVNYKRVAMVPTKDPPMIYYLFWSGTDPKLIQQYGTDFSPNVVKNHPLDKYKVIDWPHKIGEDPEIARYLSPDTIYLVTQQELPYDLRNNLPPKGVRLVEIISYPDNEIAFYLITRDPNHRTPLTEPKFKDIDFL